jgi:UDP-N-acetylmuramoyl-L-alanyl-D-glutamate--2,6-diaminopimelate ligase
MTTRGRTLGSLTAHLSEYRLVGARGTKVGGLTYDSRQVQLGDFFVALTGSEVDGHQYGEDAAARGASAFLVEHPLAVDLPQIIVPNTRAALAAVAAVFYDHPSAAVNVIGVTGTDGKTTTSYLIDAILRTNGVRTGMVGTVAVRIGDRLVPLATRQTTPESADIQRYLRDMVTENVRWAILEATSHGLAMHRLDLVTFAIAAVTNITREHLDFHGTVENYRRAKAILFQRTTDDNGLHVINIDDPGAASIRSFADPTRTLTYSATGQSATLRASDVRPRPDGSSFMIHTAGSGTACVHLPLVGDFNVANALCAAGVALAAGVDLEGVVNGLETAPPVPGRMVNVDAGQPFGVVVDYAHTPEALAHILTLLRGLRPAGRLISVFGSAGERDIEKRARQGAIAAKLADFAIFTNEDPRNEDADQIIAQIASGAREHGGHQGRTFDMIPDRRQAIARAFDVAREGDCVLLAGKGHEQSIIVGHEKVPWDEEGVARAVLAEMGWNEDDPADLTARP